MPPAKSNDIKTAPKLSVGIKRKDRVIFSKEIAITKNLELPAVIDSTLNMTSVFYVQTDKSGEKVQDKELKLQVYLREL
jgi:hypothetical protein